VLRIGDNLIAGIWLAGLAVWIAAAFRVKRAKRVAPTWQQAGHHLLSVAAFGLFTVPAWHTGLLTRRLLPRNDSTMALGVGVLALGMAFAVWARVRLGRNWSGMVTVKEDHRLIRTGPYALVRHPIYTGLITAVFGTAIALGRVCHGLAVVSFFLAYWLKSRLEERWMLQEFGDEYQRYRNEVRALIPFVW
jgi:protein-S-isoprenylcysteine O-methyltransferase Ste14